MTEIRHDDRTRRYRIGHANGEVFAEGKRLCTRCGRGVEYELRDIADGIDGF